MAWRARLGTLLIAPSVTAGFVLGQSVQKDNAIPTTNQCSTTPIVCAKARKRGDGDGPKVNPKRRRFADFATIQINGELYMTPADFLESVTEAKPRKSAYRISYSAHEIQDKLLATTPPHESMRRGDTQEMSCTSVLTNTIP